MRTLSQRSGSVAQELGVYTLAIEVALEARQRRKLDCYADHQFLNVYRVALDRITGQLALHEPAAFITQSVVLRAEPPVTFKYRGWL